MRNTMVSFWKMLKKKFTFCLISNWSRQKREELTISCPSGWITVIMFGHIFLSVLSICHNLVSRKFPDHLFILFSLGDWSLKALESGIHPLAYRLTSWKLHHLPVTFNMGNDKCSLPKNTLFLRVGLKPHQVKKDCASLQANLIL